MLTKLNVLIDILNFMYISILPTTVPTASLDVLMATDQFKVAAKDDVIPEIQPEMGVHLDLPRQRSASPPRH